MGKKISPQTQARRESLAALRRAAETGALPDQPPPGLDFGQYSGFWVTPNGRVFAPASPPEQAASSLDVIVDPCGCGSANERCGMRFFSDVAWARSPAGALDHAEWWRASDGRTLAVVSKGDFRTD